jgi:hypothetical protein
MLFLAVAVAFVGVLSVLNLALCLAIIRRLREHTALLSRADIGGSSQLLAVGTEVPAFTTRTVDGGEVGTEDLVAGAAIGFFSPSCGPCKERLPEFVEWARGVADPRRVFAVIAPGPAEQPVGAGMETEMAVSELAVSEMATAVREVSTVIVERSDGPVTAAFNVTGYPTFYLLGEDRKIRSGSHSTDILPAHEVV